MRQVLALIGILVIGPLAAHARAEDAPDRGRHIIELQVGGGVLVGNQTVGPFAHVQARFALWRTVGFGVYGGGAYLGGVRTRAVYPLCARLNLSLPFWRRFEPVVSLGAGQYLFDRSGGGNPTGSFTGAHLAVATLFPAGHHGMGIEAAAHLTEDTRYPGNTGVIGTLAATFLIRSK